VPFTPAASSVPSVPVPAMPLVLVPTPAVPEALLVPLFPLPLLPRLALEPEGATLVRPNRRYTPRQKPESNPRRRFRLVPNEVM
jgi:hypothetical protein